MESAWKQCEALAHPQFNPLRAVLFMIYITYLPHVLRIPMVFKAQVCVMCIPVCSSLYSAQRSSRTPLGVIFPIPLLLFQTSNQGYYNNLHARTQTDGRLDDRPFGKAVYRATSAHQNSFEALILFSAACFAAHLAKVDAGTASGLCGFFLACRFLYVLLYIGGTHAAIGVARSLVWVGGFAASLRLFGLALAKMGL